ncbi:hypothetical protein PMAYCL1PPCAC_15184, partial [Pristionchus mayeri]
VREVQVVPRDRADRPDIGCILPHSSAWPSMHFQTFQVVHHVRAARLVLLLRVSLAGRADRRGSQSEPAHSCTAFLHRHLRLQHPQKSTPRERSGRRCRRQRMSRLVPTSSPMPYPHLP